MEEKTSKKGLKAATMITLGVLLIVVAVFLLIWFLLNGEKTVTGGYPGAEKVVALSCLKQNETHPVLKDQDDKTEVKDLRIDAIFSGQELNSIALMYMLYYNNAEQINVNEPKLHIALNNAFSKDDLSPDAFSANYNKLPEGLKITFYATRSEVTENAAKYFLLDFAKRNPLTLDSMKKNYEEKDFVCSINDK